MSQVDGCGLSGASDDDDDCGSSAAGSSYDEPADIVKTAMSDEVTKQLAAAGAYSISQLPRSLAIELFQAGVAIIAVSLDQWNHKGNYGLPY